MKITKFFDFSLLQINLYKIDRFKKFIIKC